MTYKETTDFLFSQLPMFQRIGASAYKANLDTTLALDKYFGFPHKKFQSIHVAGTNGKGSVSHSLASILMSAGYKVGLYTSPHLVDFKERIKINGEMITENAVIEFVSQNREIISELKPSFFEISVALAFQYFENQQIDIAVVEVGMGGRLDSTNIITPLISVITNISYDHTQFLGSTLELIATEKAGIIKEKIPVVIGKTQNETKPVFEKIAKEKNAELFFADQNYKCSSVFQSIDSKQIFNIEKYNKLIFKNLKLDLLGFYQRENILTVLQTVEVLNTQKLIDKQITDSILYDALTDAASRTGLNGRWQIVGNNPLMVCDTGHNEAGIKFVIQQIAQTAFKKLHFILGMVNDKEIEKILAFLPKNAIYYFTKASIPRALDESILKEKAEKFNLIGNSYLSVTEAVKFAKQNAEPSDFIFIGGSTFIVADFLNFRHLTL
jgi:dihydrofolate synthase/folylpolyglutamate synthase